MKIEILRKKMEDYLVFAEARKGTKQKYRRALAMVYRVIPNLEFSRPNIIGFIAVLRRGGYKPSVVRFYYFFLKSLVENVLGDDWPFKQKEAPPEPEQKDLNQPILGEIRIKEMIKQAKNANLHPADLTRFTLSTVYGARRIELAEQNEASVNLKRKVVRIETRKHGEPRTHVLPDEILPFLHPTWLKPIDISEMSETFIRIEKVLGFEHQKGFGWHSIRRRLATWFDDHDVSEKNIDIFMRWKRRKTTQRRYVVRTPVEIEKVQAEVDKKIFKIHPFLPTWRG